MRYSRAPIIEALIDIQVSFEKIPTDGRLNSFIKSLEEFSSREDITVDTAEIHSSKKGTQVSSSREVVGFKLSSPEHSYVLQIKKTGITFSILKHYDEWETFSKEAKKYWKKYKDFLNPTKVHRVAVRYINRIDVPETFFKFEDYFDLYPRVFKEDNADVVSGFFMQVQIPQREGGMAVINQSPTSAPRPGYSSIILDIDVFDLKPLEPKGASVWERIDKLRDQKNHIFEQSITDKTRDLIR